MKPGQDIDIDFNFAIAAGMFDNYESINIPGDFELKVPEYYRAFIMAIYGKSKLKINEFDGTESNWVGYGEFNDIEFVMPIEVLGESTIVINNDGFTQIVMVRE